jgi:hypothetical protein
MGTGHGAGTATVIGGASRAPFLTARNPPP